MRLAVIVSHPTQYYSPWFARVASALKERGGQLRVFYLWDFGVREQLDPKFGRAVQWDVPLLEGHDHEFVANVSPRPGTHWFGGLDNPELVAKVGAFQPGAVLQFGYNHKALVGFDLRWDRARSPLLFRGDSHLLGDEGSGSVCRAQWWKSGVRKLALRRLFRRFALFLAVGEANADYFRAHGVPAEKIAFCPHAVDNAFFSREKIASVQFSGGGVQQTGLRGLRGELGIQADELVFLFAGKFEEKKQPLQLLEAFLKADTGPATLLFAGSGELEARLKSVAPSGGATAKRIVFLPFQNQSRMPEVYRTGDVLVLPSRGRYETWGLAVNEAACCGLPAIVSSHVGCGPDLIRHGQTGWVFPAGDLTALAAALQEAVAARGRLRRMGECLRDLIVERYSYSAATSALMAALGSLRRA